MKKNYYRKWNAQAAVKRAKDLYASRYKRVVPKPELKNPAER